MSLASTLVFLNTTECMMSKFEFRQVISSDRHCYKLNVEMTPISTISDAFHWIKKVETFQRSERRHEYEYIIRKKLSISSWRETFFVLGMIIKILFQACLPVCGISLLEVNAKSWPFSPNTMLYIHRNHLTDRFLTRTNSRYFYPEAIMPTIYVFRPSWALDSVSKCQPLCTILTVCLRCL